MTEVNHLVPTLETHASAARAYIKAAIYIGGAQSISMTRCLGLQSSSSNLPCLTVEAEEAASCPKSASGTKSWEETSRREEVPLLPTKVLRRTRSRWTACLPEADSKLPSPSLITAVDSRATVEMQRQPKIGTRSRCGWGRYNIVVITVEAGCPVEAPHLFHGYTTATLQKAIATSQQVTFSPRWLTKLL